MQAPSIPQLCGWGRCFQICTSCHPQCKSCITMNFSCPAARSMRGIAPSLCLHLLCFAVQSSLLQLPQTYNYSLKQNLRGHILLTHMHPAKAALKPLWRRNVAATQRQWELFEVMCHASIHLEDFHHLLQALANLMNRHFHLPSLTPLEFYQF